MNEHMNESLHGGGQQGKYTTEVSFTTHKASQITHGVRQCPQGPLPAPHSRGRWLLKSPPLFPSLGHQRVNFLHPPRAVRPNPFLRQDSDKEGRENLPPQGLGAAAGQGEVIHLGALFCFALFFRKIMSIKSMCRKNQTGREWQM